MRGMLRPLHIGVFDDLWTRAVVVPSSISSVVTLPKTKTSIPRFVLIFAMRDASQKTQQEDIAHMRRVVSYCKRHLAQEEKLKDSKTPEELENTKSTKSLKVSNFHAISTLGSDWSA